jgi:hypothetical protein
MARPSSSRSSTTPTVWCCPARPSRCRDHRERLALSTRPRRASTGSRRPLPVFTVKANQPTLRTALVRLPWAQVSGLLHRTVGHGRIESRSIKVIDLDGAPEAGLFPHGTRAIKVVRRRRCARPGQAIGGDGAHQHLPGPPRHRPAAAGRLEPLALDDREPSALGPRRNRECGPLQPAHRQRT